MAVSRSGFFSLVVVLFAVPRAALAQDSSSRRPCDDRFRTRVMAWRAAHPTDQENVAVVGVDTLDSLPQVLSRPLPQYPPEALRAGYQGTVIVVALVTEDGKVSSADAIDSRVEPHWGVTNPMATSPNSSDLAAWEFRRAAVQAVRLTRYRPGFRDGEPVATLLCMPLTFKILPLGPPP